MWCSSLPSQRHCCTDHQKPLWIKPRTESLHSTYYSHITHWNFEIFFFRNVKGNLSLIRFVCFSPPPTTTTASLRAELNHLHATSIEHLKQIHLKENNAAKRELESAMEHSHKQVGNRRRSNKCVRQRLQAASGNRQEALKTTLNLWPDVLCSITQTLMVQSARNWVEGERHKLRFSQN